MNYTKRLQTILSLLHVGLPMDTDYIVGDGGVKFLFLILSLAQCKLTRQHFQKQVLAVHHFHSRLLIGGPLNYAALLRRRQTTHGTSSSWTEKFQEREPTE